jgi:hypothetical protein
LAIAVADEADAMDMTDMSPLIELRTGWAARDLCRRQSSALSSRLDLGHAETIEGR